MQKQATIFSESLFRTDFIKETKEWKNRLNHGTDLIFAK